MNHHLLSPRRSIKDTRIKIVERIKPRKLKNKRKQIHMMTKRNRDLVSALPFSFFSSLFFRPSNIIDMERKRRKKDIIKGNKYGESFHSTLKPLWEMRDITTPKTETNSKNTPSQKVEENFLFSTMYSFTQQRRRKNNPPAVERIG